MKHRKVPRDVAARCEGNPDPNTIEIRADEFHLERDRDSGHELEEWLRAEVELKPCGGATHAEIVGKIQQADRELLRSAKRWTNRALV